MRKAECGDTRKVIFDNVSWINNLDVRLDAGDPEYWEQTDELDYKLRAIHQAFDDKPVPCLMICDEPDSYKCENCGFEVAINIDSSTA